MWNLIDIGYVIPASVIVGYFVGQYLDANCEGHYSGYTILISIILGFILTIIKIKRYIDHINKPPKPEPDQE